MTRVMIIAEAGVNHNGSIELARRLVDAAAEAGADAVKFQTFKAERVISKNAPKAEYQTRTTGGSESQLEMVRKLELDENAHQTLIEHCRARRIQFLSTPFDLESIDLLAGTLDLPVLKLPSGEITNAPFLLKAACTGKRLILSTGMSTLEEIEAALGVIAFALGGKSAQPSIHAFKQAYGSTAGRKALEERVTLLHCTTEYPAPFGEINLRAMQTMRAKFRLPVGYSDHTVGITVPISAAALGATVIEKHFTLDRALPGPDHVASLLPSELKAMVTAIREVELALGSEIKAPSPSELKNLVIARKSLVAARPVREGEVFTETNLTAKRPGGGISPMHYYEWLGKISRRAMNEDEEIS